MRWKDIVGHADAIKILKNMLTTGRIPHALLFTGPTGLGKMLIARILAAGLLCGGNSLEKPCGNCSFCHKVEQNSHPDLTVLPGDGTSLKIDQIRALQHEAALVPYYGERHVFIIEEAERLTAQAANSLLKILEEPPAGTVFILTAASTHALPPTVVSRCWLLPFYPLSSEALACFLAGNGADPTKAMTAARMGGGRVGAALSLLAPDGLAIRDQAVEIIAALPAYDNQLTEETAAAMDKLEASGLQVLLCHFIYILRDLFVKHAGQDKLMINQDIAAKLSDMAGLWDEARLSAAMEDVKYAQRALEANANSRLTCEALLIKLTDAVKEGDN